MGRYLGQASGYALDFCPATAPAVGEFPTASTTASGTTNATAISAKLGGIQVNTDTTWADGHLLRNADFSAATLGTGSPPDGWAMQTGTWATDARLNNGSQTMGMYTLQLLNTGVAAALDGPWFPVEETANYMFGVKWKAATTTVTFTAELLFYQADKTTAVGSAKSIVSTTASSANTYQQNNKTISAPTNARYAKVRVRKDTTAQIVTIDYLVSAKNPSSSASELPVIPVGGVIPVFTNLTGVSTPSANFFVSCDGQVLSDTDSPLNGQTIPDINGQGYFLRGSTTAGTTQTSQNLDHAHTLLAHTHSLNSHTHTTPELSHSITQPVIASATTGITASMAHTHTVNVSEKQARLDAGTDVYYGVGSANPITTSAASTSTVTVNDGGHTHTLSTNVGISNHAASTTGASSGNTGVPSSDSTNNNGGAEARPVNISARYYMRIK